MIEEQLFAAFTTEDVQCVVQGDRTYTTGADHSFLLSSGEMVLADSKAHSAPPLEVSMKTHPGVDVTLVSLESLQGSRKTLLARENTEIHHGRKIGTPCTFVYGAEGRTECVAEPGWVVWADMSVVDSADGVTATHLRPPELSLSAMRAKMV